MPSYHGEELSNRLVLSMMTLEGIIATEVDISLQPQNDKGLPLFMTEQMMDLKLHQFFLLKRVFCCPIVIILYTFFTQ